MVVPTDEVPLVSSNGHDKYCATADDDVVHVPTIRQPKLLHFVEIIAIYIDCFRVWLRQLTTLFLITLPVECKRIQHEHPTVQKSISLAVFVAIAGITQLVTPLVGMLSDTYKPPTNDIGQRMPDLVPGAILTVVGLLGQGSCSMWSFWVRYFSRLLFTYDWFEHYLQHDDYFDSRSSAGIANRTCKWHLGSSPRDRLLVWI
jgi:hypothetical protein